MRRPTERRRRAAARALRSVLAIGLAALGLGGQGCAGSRADPPPTPDSETLRNTPSGPVVGFVSERGAHVWRGLPFAQPPVGALRWRAPRAPEPWIEPRPAVEFGAPCPQIAVRARRAMEDLEPGEPRGSEDCLYLNVFAPPSAPGAVPDGDDRLPVMVWIHGGGNTIGDAHVYDASALAVAQRLVVVTVHYRLGVFGWFSHPALRDGAEGLDRSANFATLDLVRSLEWVRDHIAAFGGDPGRVTVFGESAGGANVFSLLRSPAARGLFHRAIVESGGNDAVSREEAEALVDATPPGDPASSGETLLALLVAQGRAADRAEALEVAARMDRAETAAFLRERTAAELLAVFDGNRLGGMYRYPDIVRDGIAVSDLDDDRAFDDPSFYNAVPVILGTNRDENRLFLLFGSDYVGRVFGLPVRLKDPRRYELDAHYQSLMWKARGVDGPAAAMRAAQGPSVYAYRFDWDEEPRWLWLDFSRLLGAAHGLEIPFVFGTLDFGFANRFVFDEQRRPAARALSDAMMSYWANFAYGGTPGRGRDGSLPSWGAWSPGDGGKFMVFDTDADGGIRMSDDAVTPQIVLDRIAADERFEEVSERCALYRGFVQWGRGLSAQQYAEIEDGACAAWPLEAADE